jgi:hypothetical protein
MIDKPGAQAPEVVALALRAFADAYKAPTAQEAMRRACELLRERAGEDIPPIGLRKLLAACGARRNSRMLPIPGRLDIDREGFIVQVNAGDRWRRQRFTAAHEIGHILVFKALASTPHHIQVLRTREGWEEIERLCNLAAAELLIPKGDLVFMLQRIGFSPASLQQLYDRYMVSWSTLFVRLVEALPGSALSLWQIRSHGLNSEPALRVNKCYGGSCGTWLPQHATARKHVIPNVVEQAWREQASVGCDVLTIAVGGRRVRVKGLATIAPAFRNAMEGQLPLFQGYRVPDEPVQRFEVILFLWSEQLGEDRLSPWERIWAATLQQPNESRVGSEREAGLMRASE